MTSSLVGSEMCIRDRDYIQAFLRAVEEVGLKYGLQLNETKCELLRSVSYTHLTLPTICSV
eukprot:11550939-Prorocentrum_lima.AAC.1